MGHSGHSGLGRPSWAAYSALSSINLFCLNHFHLPTDIHLGLFSKSLAGCFVDALAKPHPRFPVFCASPVLTTRR
ncbi:hypothetical protein ACQRIT_006891 [Beauveria bassiana]